MAANHHHPHARPMTQGQTGCLTADALSERLEEEINRAGRHGTPLSCLLVVIDNIEEFSHEQGGALPEQVFAYLARALERELRRFDRIGRPSDGELLLLLPGADGPRGEIVARRVLERMRTIKVEAEGLRRPLRVSVGLVSWRRDVSAEELLAQARAATQREQAEEAAAEIAAAPPLPPPQREKAGGPAAEPAAPPPLRSASPPALGRPGPS